MGCVIQGTPAGMGRLPISDLIHRLKELGRCQSAILELWVPPGATVVDTIQTEEAWLQKSLQYLIEIF